MVSRFPRDWDILYVEPSFWLSIAWRIINKTPFGKNARPRDNVEVVSVPTIPFADKFGPTRRCNDRIIAKKMKKILRDRGISEPALLFYKPRYACVIGELGESLVCYDITDDVREFEASSAWLEEYIKKLESESDAVFTPSAGIHKRLQGRKNLFLIGNGAEAAHFEKASLEKTPIPADVRYIAKPVIGYVGAIGEWFDFDLLERILREFPTAAVVLVGWAFSRQKRRLAKIRSENLYFLGPRQYAELPGYIKAFDVCIIPFLANRLTRSVNPNKFYEYLASGRPIVTTELPEIAKYADVCRMARTHDEFIDGIRRAAAGGHDSKAARTVARQNDWDGKASEMSGLIRRLWAGDQI